MTDRSLIYRIQGASWALELPVDQLQAIQSQAQRKWWSKEAAGQLFSTEPGSDMVRVDAVTKLPARAATRTGLRLDIPAVRKEREAFFERGLHCLGFWHTHPEPVPTPSPADMALAADHASASSATFGGLVFVIVGTAAAPAGVGVWVHDGTTLWPAPAETTVCPTRVQPTDILSS